MWLARVHLDASTRTPHLFGVPDSAPASWSAAVLLPLLFGPHRTKSRGVCLPKKKRQKDSRTPRRWRVVGLLVIQTGRLGAFTTAITIRPFRRMLQLEEHLAGFWHQQ